jgi:lysophospholipase L1-like esterase
MKLLYKVSLLLNVVVIAAIVYLAINGENLIRNYIFKNVIEVRHEQKLSMFRATPISTGAIVFVGNSITEGGNWGELFPEHQILNRGIGGDISEGILKRLDEIIRHQPSKLFISIGTNDLAKGTAQSEIIQNYRTILKVVQTKSPETQIYVQSVLPVGKNVIFKHDNEKIMPLNIEIEKLCSEMQVTYIDLYSSFIDEAGYLNPAYTNDNLHLLGEGYLLWREIIKSYVLSKKIDS